jgi:hypothetical protein
MNLYRRMLSKLRLLTRAAPIRATTVREWFLAGIES